MEEAALDVCKLISYCILIGDGQRYITALISLRCEVSERAREGGSEQGREGAREGGREGARARAREGVREGNGGVVDGSTHIHEPIPPCDARRREKVGALYSAVSGLLAIISRAYPRFLSPVLWNIYPWQYCSDCGSEPRFTHELIHNVTQGERKSGSSLQHCFWLISRHQQSIPSISLSCAMEYACIPVSSAVMCTIEIGCKVRITLTCSSLW